MSRETYCFLSLTISLPLTDTETGLEPLSFQSWAFGQDPKETLRLWKKDNPVLAQSLTASEIITPKSKTILPESDLPKPNGAGKPRGVFAKPHERTAGKIHVTHT